MDGRMVRALRGMAAGGVTARGFGAAAGLGEDDSREVLEELERRGIGEVRGGSRRFDDGDRLRAAVMLLEEGHAAGDISEHLHWRDFEGLAAEILGSHDFEVARNMVFVRPRMEIDVVGTRLGVSMLVDCKHWAGTAAFAAAAKRQAERARRYVAANQGAAAVPVIVTLRDMAGLAGGVPVVPISRFDSFVDGFFGGLEGMLVIR